MDYIKPRWIIEQRTNIVAILSPKCHLTNGIHKGLSILIKIHFQPGEACRN